MLRWIISEYKWGTCTRLLGKQDANCYASCARARALQACELAGPLGPEALADVVEELLARGWCPHSVVSALLPRKWARHSPVIGLTSAGTLGGVR